MEFHDSNGFGYIWWTDKLIYFSSIDSWIAGQMNSLRTLSVTWTYSQVYVSLRARASLGVNILGYGCVYVCRYLCACSCACVLSRYCAITRMHAMCVALIQEKWNATSAHVRMAPNVRSRALDTRVNVLAHSTAITVNVGSILPLVTH